MPIPAILPLSCPNMMVAGMQKAAGLKPQPPNSDMITISPAKWNILHETEFQICI